MNARVSLTWAWRMLWMSSTSRLLVAASARCSAASASSPSAPALLALASSCSPASSSA